MGGRRASARGQEGKGPAVGDREFTMSIFTSCLPMTGGLTRIPGQVPSAVEIPAICGQKITKVVVRTLQSGDRLRRKPVSLAEPQRGLRQQA